MKETELIPGFGEVMEKSLKDGIPSIIFLLTHSFLLLEFWQLRAENGVQWLHNGKECHYHYLYLLNYR